MVDHLDDIESDLSAFHRIDNWEDMPARRFLLLAERLGHYRGAIRNIMLAATNEQEGGGAVTTQDRPVPSEVATGHAGFAGDAATGFPPVFEVGRV